MGQEKRPHPKIPKLQKQILQAFIEALPNVAVIKDLEGRYLFVNPVWERVFHKGREQWLGKTAEELWPPKVAAKFNEHDRILLRTKEPLVTEGTLPHTDGLHHWIAFKFPIFDTDGQLAMIGINAIDISEHVQIKTRLEHWLESGPTVIYTREPRGDFAFTYLSSNIQTLMGLEPRQFFADPRFWFNHIHPEDQLQVQEQLTLPWPKESQSLEYRLQIYEGNYLWIHDSFKMVRDQNGQPLEIAGAWLDISERKTLEAQLIQAQKMEAVGRLAGGVAHDFNNLLMAIMGYGELLRTHLYQDDPLFHYIEDILKAADRAASLTQQLLAFSRRQMRQPQVLNLNRVVADLEKMLRRLIGEHIDLEIVAEPDLGKVQADAGQIGQIVLNLAVNARDAMPTGGRLVLGTANVDFADTRQGRIESIPPGRYVGLTVTDTGVGMDAETLSHIFEPFFTTQEVGRGTGLGLPVVYGIVRQNGGYLEVDSKPGQGTAFTVYLPRSEDMLARPFDSIALQNKLEGSETVLIVEDDLALRNLLSRFFRLYGYAVLEARDGDEAILICRQHQGLIHIMLTDVVMPRMSGRELADHLTPLHPEMQIFYMSGYSDSELAPFGIAEPSRTILPKPFRPLDLVRKVRELLDTPKEDPHTSLPS
jgi:two-component system, cell cycle sensor histidine kinase and response regulator CckA